MSSKSYWPSEASWKHYWPAKLVSLIGIFQNLLSFCVLALQAAIVGIGIGVLCYGVTTRFIMGFVCWIFFEACSISACCVGCCNRSSVGCATFTLVMNILAFIFSAVLIDFDRKFIDNRLFDYKFRDNYEVCDAFNFDYNDYGPSESKESWWNISEHLSKEQLAAAVIILVLSLAYVGIYIYTYIRAIKGGGGIVHYIPNPTTMPVIVQSNMPYAPPPLSSSINTSNAYSKTANCPNCGSHIKKSPNTTNDF